MNARTVAPGLGVVLLLAGCSAEAIPAGPGLPNGTYRVEVTEDEVRSAGYGNGHGWSGLWTMTVEDGAYQLDCKPVGNPGVDCGNSTGPGPYEAGVVRGDRARTLFEHDPEALAQLTGCSPCAGAFSYSASWSSEGSRVTFSEVEGLGVHLVIEPWEKIS